MSMTSKLLTSFLTAALATSLAQGPGRFQGNGTAAQKGNHSGQPQLVMTQLQEISGPVTAVNIGTGMEYPTIEVDGKIVRVAPVWFLLENDFEIAQNDFLVLQAAPSSSTADPYLHAIWIRNQAANKEIQLRDENGVALWSGGRGRSSQGESHRGNGRIIGGCGLSDIATVSGSVTKVVLGTGIKQPNIELNTASGVLSIKIGPSRVMLEVEFQIDVGDQLTVKYGATNCTDEKVALEITNLTKGGIMIVLRDEEGRPVW